MRSQVHDLHCGPWRRGRRTGLASGAGSAEVLALEQARHGVADYQSPANTLSPVAN